MAPYVKDLAYLAGAIDADGWIMVCKGPPRCPNSAPRYWLRVGLQQCDPEAAQLASQSLGGPVHIRKAGKWSWRQSYHWEANGAGAETVLKLLLPYLRIKRRQAEYALRMRRTLGDGRLWRRRDPATGRVKGPSPRWAALVEAFYLGMRALVKHRRMTHA